MCLAVLGPGGLRLAEPKPLHIAADRRRWSYCALNQNQHPCRCRKRELTSGLQFQDHWIKQGVEGGKKAAYALRSAVAEKCGDRADEIEFTAKVFANVTGLGRAMIRDGCLDDLQDLRDFTLGFTQAKASFDFIDVGYGKERADAKIRGATHPGLHVMLRSIQVG